MRLQAVECVSTMLLKKPTTVTVMPKYYAFKGLPIATQMYKYLAFKGPPTAMVRYKCSAFEGAHNSNFNV